MNKFLETRSHEGGSIVLALLAAVVIGGIVVTLMAQTVTGQRQVRFDRSFGNAIHAADSGVHAAVTAINHAEVDPDDPQPVGTVLEVDRANAMTGAGDTDTEFWYTATKESKTRWEIDARGEASDGTLRRVMSTVEIPPIFQYAAFAKVNVGTSGDNCADSYNSDSPQALNTGKGVMGTNGAINIASSTAACTDGIELHDFYDDPDDPNDDGKDDIEVRVDICNSEQCRKFHVLQDHDPTGKVFGLFPKPLVIDDWWIERSLNNGQDERPDNSTNPTYQEDCQDENGVAGVDSTTLEFTKDNPLVRGRVYCSTAGVHFKRVSSSGEKIPLTGASTDPVVIYTSGPVAADGQIWVNCDNCATPTAGSLPVGPDLQIYSTGPELTIRQQTQIGALLYAPRAVCDGGANVHVWGAIVCQEMQNSGTWNFHFDQSSRTPSAASYRITHWYEEQKDS